MGPVSAARCRLCHTRETCITSFIFQMRSRASCPLGPFPWPHPTWAELGPVRRPLTAGLRCLVFRGAAALFRKASLLPGQGHSPLLSFTHLAHQRPCECAKLPSGFKYPWSPVLLCQTGLCLLPPSVGEDPLVLHQKTCWSECLCFLRSIFP